MARARSWQLSLADGLLRPEAGPCPAGPDGGADRLGGDRGKLLAPLRQGRMGAPAYPSLALFKALLLQQWHCLSDEALEEAIADRLSFRRFMGLALADTVPDHAATHKGI